MPLKTGPDTLSIDNAKLPFAEQIAFFRGKKGLNLPSEHFDDITAEQHLKGFAVAGAMKADLLTDFYNAVEEAISEGQSIDWFRKQFDAITEKHGWSHTGSAGWRTRTIYQTNMLTSYAQGRAAQLADPELRAALPYLRYNLGNSENHRPLHVSWAGMTLAHDDPWWDTHMPVKAWGCHCWVSATAGPNPAKSVAPKDAYYEHVDRWGEIHRIPAGVDYGFHRTETEGGFWPAGFPTPPPAYYKAAAHEIDRRLGRWADYLGEDKAALARRLDGEVAAAVDKAQIFIRMDKAMLAKALEGGEIKSSFGAGIDKKIFDALSTSVFRSKFEGEVLGVEAGAAARPVYGYLSQMVGGNLGGNTWLDAQGGIAVRLAPNVRARATVAGKPMTGVMAQHTPSIIARPVVSPDRTLLEIGTTPGKSNAPKVDIDNGVLGYYESQIHGGIKLSDIDCVYLTKAPSKALAALLDKKKVRYNIVEPDNRPDFNDDPEW